MHHNRLAKNALRAATVLVILLPSIVVLFILDQRRTQAEGGAVLSGYLSDEVLHNSHDWGSGHHLQMILQREAQQPEAWNSRWGMPFPQASFVTRISFFLSNVFTSNIRAELHLPREVESMFVRRGELEQMRRTDFQRSFPHSLGYIAVSQVGFNFSKTEAIFYIDHFCGLCGGGGYILMRKANGIWRVIDQRSTWVS